MRWLCEFLYGNAKELDAVYMTNYSLFCCKFRDAAIPQENKKVDERNKGGRSGYFELEHRIVEKVKQKEYLTNSNNLIVFSKPVFPK